MGDTQQVNSILFGNDEEPTPKIKIEEGTQPAPPPPVTQIRPTPPMQAYGRPPYPPGAPSQQALQVLQFIRFMEIVKKKLPAAQEQIVTKLNLEFQQQTLKIDKYMEQLKQGIGKMKVELLVNQYRTLQQEGKQRAEAQKYQELKNAQAAMTGGGFHPGIVPTLTTEQQRQQSLLVKRPLAVASPLAGSELNPQAKKPNITVRTAVKVEPDQMETGGPTMSHIPKYPTSMGNPIPSSSNQMGNNSGDSSDGSDLILINHYSLRQRIESVVKNYKISNIDEEVFNFISLALHERLRTVAEELIVISNKRLDQYKNQFTFSITSDTKSALRVITQREQDIARRKEAEEKERILEVAKSQKKEMKDDKVLQDKINKVFLEDEAKRTNETALHAVFGNRKKSQTSSLNSNPNQFNNFRHNFEPQPTQTLIDSSSQLNEGKRITFKDALVFVEREELQNNYSMLAYKWLMGKEMLKYGKSA